MIDAVIDGLKSVFYWFINLFFELINPIIDTIFENFPSLQKTFGAGLTIMSHANFFLPLTYGLGLLTALLLIQSTFVFVKLIIKIFLPGFG